MKVYRSKQMAMLATVVLFVMGLAVMCIPVPVTSKAFMILAFVWFWYEQCQQHILLQKPSSIHALECDEHQKWTLLASNRKFFFANLSPKSVASAHWMCLYFVGISHRKNFCILLSSDSLSKRDWSVLQMVIRFAKPIKAVHCDKKKDNL
jgi:hypothetical protein